MDSPSSHSGSHQTEYRRLLRPMPSQRPQDAGQAPGVAVDSRLADMFPPRGTPEERIPNVAGITLGHFELISRIGQGGMGSVFEARDTRLDRLDALKVLSPLQAADPAVVQRFHNEARAAAKLDHENIARVHFIGEDAGIHFIAFEYVRGVTIRELIQRRGMLSQGDSINYALQVAEALKQTQAAEMVHRDIKPSNLIVMPSGRVKLVDLGLARQFLTDPAQDPELTASGTTLGTFDYISPEQSRNPKNVDVRSDIYSLGCTLFHMLTGEVPYEAASPVDKMIKHGEEETPLVTDRKPHILPRLAIVVRRMMSPYPDERYQTPDDLIRELAEVAIDLGLKAVGPEGSIWKQPLLSSRGLFAEQHRGWILAFSALLVMIFLGDMGFRWYRDFKGGGAATLAVSTDQQFPLSQRDQFDSRPLGLPEGAAVPSAPFPGPYRIASGNPAETSVANSAESGVSIRTDSGTPLASNTASGQTTPNGVDSETVASTGASTRPPKSTSTPATPTVGTGHAGVSDTGSVPVGRPATSTNDSTTPSQDSRTLADNAIPVPRAATTPRPNPNPFDLANVAPFDVSMTGILTGTTGIGPAEDNLASSGVGPRPLTPTTTPVGDPLSTPGGKPGENAGSGTSTVPATGSVPTAAVSRQEQFPFVLLAKGGAERRRFSTLESACLEADDNSEIEIDYDGVLAQPQRPIVIRNKRLTVRPTRGKRPTITLAPNVDLLNSSSVRMISIEGENASLQLYDIDLQMTVVGNPFAEEWSLFSLAQARQLLLKRVTATIENPQGRTAIFIDRRARNDRRVDMMPNPAVMRNTEIVCSDSLFRGAATLYSERTHDEGSLRLSQVGIAIDGDILSLTGVDLVDMEKPGIGRPLLRCEFDHVSFVTPRRFLAIDTAEVRDCSDIDITCNNSVLDLTGTDTQLFALKSHLDSDTLLNRVAWRGSHNVIAMTSETVMRVVGSLPRGDDSWTATFDEWRQTYRTEQAGLELVRLPVIDSAKTKTAAAFTQSELDDFRLIETLADGIATNPAIGGAADRSNAGFDPSRSELPRTQPASDADSIGQRP